ncbi:glucosamine-6-phosphate deaminase [Bacilliculturomica massiliensis]|uniref:glucosamine-6-phosphate deaminase n=1 Tax=Bacilliculturomica massiliensis TaxID=1917867 RepID=UPI00103192FA|nr:glucosamine-6-phosphate deaminase [Bacilliculturomica massiliensis]
MKIIRATDYRDMSRKAANFLSAQVILKENCVLGLATGSTVLGIYEQLIQWYNKGDIDFSAVSTVNLDEYAGLSSEDPNSYGYYMNTNLFRHINIDPRRCHLPDGTAADLTAECLHYEELIQQLGGIDMQLLGLGENGHIGFNEPHQSFAQMTHVVELSESTRAANARFFSSEEDVPKQAVTMGVKRIMQARRILLCVSGQRKARILKEVLFGPVIPAIPGSILQMHPRLTVVADADALAEIRG